MALPIMQKKNLAKADEVTVAGLIKKEYVKLDGVEVQRVTFGNGARWSNDFKPIAKTESCMLPHVAYVQSGRLAVVMNDGSREEFGPGDVMLLPPGHDAWAIGDEPCVFIEFSQGTNYYRETLTCAGYFPRPCLFLREGGDQATRRTPP